MLRKILWSTSVASAVGLACLISGCSSSSSSSGASVDCSKKGPCANDQAPSQSSIDQCNMGLADAKCGSAASAFASCAESNTSCNAAGMSQLNSGACTNEEATYFSCIASELDAGTD